MEKIASFCINHMILKKGMYISRVDDDIVTYDIRMKLPNQGDYLDNGSIHSFEHLFASYVRNTSFGKNIIYVGPMGCRTGFYFITRNLDHGHALELFKGTLVFIASFTQELPGVSALECGNYKEHNQEGAITMAKEMLAVLKDWTVEQLQYED